MITPVTKKLSRVKQFASRDKNGVPYQPLFNDEVFYQVPRIKFLYVSQYARLIRTYKNAAPRLLSPAYNPESGYTTLVITIPKRKNGKESERKCFGIHDLTAQVWCEYPNFLPPDEPTEVHHIIKVKKNLQEQPIDLNFAENLKVVYEKYHSLHDDIRSIKVSAPNGNWKRLTAIEEISRYFKIPLLQVYEILNSDPAYKVNGLEYYNVNQNQSIEIRKFKLKKKKKSKKNK